MQLSNLLVLAVAVAVGFGQKQDQKLPPVPVMGFIFLKWDWTLKHKGEGTKNLMNQWSNLITQSGAEGAIFPLGAGRGIVFSQQKKDMKRHRKFLLAQPEVDYIKDDQKEYFPKGRTEPITSEEDRKDLEEEHGLTGPIDLGIPGMEKPKGKQEL